MDYKEIYNAALERAAKLRVQNPFDTVGQMVEHIFPELKESEDESIKKDLIGWIEEFPDKIWRGHYKKDVLAWLEKQGEQTHAELGQLEVTSGQELEPKFHEGDIVQYITDSTDRRKIEEIDTFCNMYHTDSSPIMFEVENEWKVVVNAEDVEQESTNNVEPKFHEGVWVVNKLGDSWHIDSFDEKNYQVSDGKGNYNWFPISKQDEMHFWTIQDAKCGDVLISSNKQPFVYNGNYTSDSLGRGRLGAYFGLNYHGELLITDSHGNNWSDLTGVQPATEEQRNILFKKLHDSDYKWDSEKKELWHKYL